MRLRPEEVAFLSQKLIEEWKAIDCASFLAEEPKVRQRIEEVFLSEIRAEQELEQEVEALLQRHEKEFRSGALDRRKMFALTKARLAKERKLIL